MNVDRGLFPGGEIGEITVTGVLGSGGMGTVYSGFDRRLERRVALKVIRPERRLDQDARQRFRREARMLSRLKHPNICQIYDLIERDEGDVLVLELVEGRSLREVISDGLSRTEALDIGRQLFEVLVVVHRQGIVHRDLKPENIIVQPGGSIKVLDFGLARTDEDGVPHFPGGGHRMASADDEDDTAEWVAEWTETLTSRKFLVGTIRYMSPEQARGEHVGPASDLFSSGLILQEMLTGEPPFDDGLPMDVLLKRVAWGDIRSATGVPSFLRIFLERLTSLSPPDRPSSRDALDRLEEILDAPRKRRRRVTMIATFCVMTLLAAGMTIQWFRASRETDRAQRSLAEAQEVSVFLEQLFQLSDPFSMEKETQSESGESITAEELLARGAATVRERFEDQPLARARFMVLLGSIHKRLGRFDKAAEMLEQAVRIRRERLPQGDPALCRALLELGGIKRLQARYGEANDYLEQALVASGEEGDEESIDRANLLEEMALLAAEQARYKEAEEYYRKVLRVRRAHPSNQDLSLALTLQRSAALEISMGHREKAHAQLTEALKIVREKEGEESVREISLLSELARLEVAAGRFREAEEHWNVALSVARRRLPEDHPLLATLLTNLANILDEQGRFSEVEPLQLEALALKERTVGTEHPDYAQILFNLGRIAENLGRVEEAEQHYRQALEIFERTLGGTHPLVGIALNSLAILKQGSEEYLEAENLYGDALDIFKNAMGEDHALVSMVLNNLGEVHRLDGRFGKAEDYYRRSLEISERANGPDHPSTAEILRGLAITNSLLGNTDEAERNFARAREILVLADMPTEQLDSDRTEASRAR